MRGSLNDQPFYGVQVTVEESADRTVGSGHLPHELEFGRRRGAGRSRPRVPGEHPGALEQRHRALGEARCRLAVAFVGPGRDLREQLIETW